jgi:hypothetical protein
MPLMLSALRAVMRYRDRVDRVLSLSTAAQGLPFTLPPVPQDMKPYREQMRSFFRTGEGLTILVVHGLDEGFRKWDAILLAGHDIADPALQDNFDKCTEVYRRARNIGPYLLQPELKDPAMLGRYAESGPGDDARLAYFIVESDRLSRNNTLTRILLVTADTLLEYVGENANVFVSNPRTRGVVESLLEEFAGKQDFDDESAQQIFRSLLGAGVVAVLDHADVLPNKPILVALYGAINDVRKDIKKKAGGDDRKTQDLLARLFGQDGLERIGRFFLVRVAADASAAVDGKVARDAVKSVLDEIVAAYDERGTFKGIFDSEATRNRILEALIEVGAGHAVEVLKRQGGDTGKPLSTAVLVAVAASVRAEASKRVLFSAIAKGEIVGDLYAVALATVAANPGALEAEADIPPIVAEMLAALAGALEKVPFRQGLAPDARDKLVSAALKVLAKHPEVLAGERKYASAVVAAALEAAAAGASGGLTAEDVESVLDSALTAAGDNAALAGMSESQAAALKAVTDALATASLPALSRRDGRKAVLFAALQAVNANPKVWTSERARQQFQPLIAAILEAVKEGRTRQILADSDVVRTFERLLAAVGQRAKGLLARDGGSADLKAILTKGWDLVEEELGRTLDRQRVPEVMERVVLAYCKAPFVLADVPGQTVNDLFNEIREWLDKL